MMTLETSSPQKVKQIRRALEKFFYTSGTNIAFYNASRNPRYKDFREACERAIYKQVLPYTKEDVLNAAINRIPVTHKITDFVLDAIISSVLVSFVDVIKGHAVFIDEFLFWAGELGGQAAFDKAGVDITFKLFNPEVLDRLKDRRNYLITSVDRTTREWIARTIASGVQQGRSHAEIAKELQRGAKEMSALRAKKIVETEVASAMGMVELETAKRNGSTHKKWITSRDEKVCLICNGNESQGRIPINEKFVSGVTTVPGHVFCRCYLEGSIPPDLDIGNAWTGA